MLCKSNCLKMAGYCMYYSVWFLTSHLEACFRSQASPFRICGEQSDTRDVGVGVVLFSACSIILLMLFALSHSSTS